jgi:uncharacterized phage-associated protein
MISAIDLSNYVISEANKLKKPLSNLKLQKILYYIQGRYMALNNEPMFPEEIEAWPYGPVVRDVYVKYVSCGALNLRPDPQVSFPLFTDEEKSCVDSVLKDKIDCSASSLVKATHRERPWLDHVNEVNKGLKPVISKASIKEFFLESK